MKMQWDLGHIEILAAVADDEAAVAGDEAAVAGDEAAVVGDKERSNGFVLCWYSGTHHPGQPWSCYRSVKHDEKDKDKNLRQKLENPLTPSTTQAELSSLPRKCHCALYLMGLLIASTLSSANGSAGCDGAIVMSLSLIHI